MAQYICKQYNFNINPDSPLRKSLYCCSRHSIFFSTAEFLWLKIGIISLCIAHFFLHLLRRKHQQLSPAHKVAFEGDVSAECNALHSRPPCVLIWQSSACTYLDMCSSNKFCTKIQNLCAFHWTFGDICSKLTNYEVVASCDYALFYFFKIYPFRLQISFSREYMFNYMSTIFLPFAPPISDHPHPLILC